ncbi:MAG: cation diffusion facilitator family transporter [Arenimonas sp.]
MAAHAHDHNHGLDTIKHEKPLWWALALTASFLIAEIVGAYLTNSLALLSDAAHMATDTLALVIALVAVRLSRLPSDAKRTYGYARFEAFGALINGTLLFVVAAYILWEAIGRFATPPEVASTGMLLIAGLGLIVNLISMRLLKAGSEESLNMKGAYLEVWSDMLGSLAVLIAAVIIYFTQWWILDPILAVLIGLWVLPRTWTLLRASIHILLEGVPDNIALSEVRELLLQTPGVESVHDLHIWSLASQSSSMTAHIVADGDVNDLQVLRKTIAERLKNSFDIHHLTLQMETSPCADKHCDSVGHEHDHQNHEQHS